MKYNNQNTKHTVQTKNIKASKENNQAIYEGRTIRVQICNF